MPGEIIAVVAQASIPSSGVDSPVLRSVSQADEASLADLLSAREAQASPAQAVQPPAADVQPTPPTNTMGDAMIRNLDAVGRRHVQVTTEIGKMVNGGATNFTVPELLRIQVMLVDTSMRVDLYSKGISKATQELDQMIKMQ